MSRGKELLLSCIVMTHISFMASGSTELGNLRANIERYVTISMCDLLTAEKDYVKHMFNEKPPNGYTSNSLEPPEGITLPVGNATEEIQASVCAITDYLYNHLPPIIRKHTQEKDKIIRNVKEFLIQFEGAVNETFVPKLCHRNETTSHDYDMKVIGLRIIYSARQWVESVLGKKIPCD